MEIIRTDEEQVTLELAHFTVDAQFIAFANTFGIYDQRKEPGMRLEFKKPVLLDNDLQITGYKYIFPAKNLRKVFMDAILFGFNNNLVFYHDGNYEVKGETLSINHKKTILHALLYRTTKWKLYKKKNPHYTIQPFD